jgi:t-SNARE complex subunit (syntaxin)
VYSFAQGRSVFMESLQGGQLLRQQESLRHVEAVHVEQLAVEKSIAQLAEVLQELALLVDAQGEAIERVETHVRDAKEYATA